MPPIPAVVANAAREYAKNPNGDNYLKLAALCAKYGLDLFKFVGRNPQVLEKLLRGAGARPGAVRMGATICRAVGSGLGAIGRGVGALFSAGASCIGWAGGRLVAFSGAAWGALWGLFGAIGEAVGGLTAAAVAAVVVVVLVAVLLALYIKHSNDDLDRMGREQDARNKRQSSVLNQTIPEPMIIPRYGNLG